MNTIPIPKTHTDSPTMKQMKVSQTLPTENEDLSSDDEEEFDRKVMTSTSHRLKIARQIQFGIADQEFNSLPDSESTMYLEGGKVLRIISIIYLTFILCVPHLRLTMPLPRNNLQNKRRNRRRRFHSNRTMIAQTTSSSRNWPKMTMMTIWRNSSKALSVQRRPKAILPTRIRSRSKPAPCHAFLPCF
jgi:hypothetical protein